MKLVIVESPTKAKTLARFLGAGYAIEASMGHIRDLPQKGGGLAIDVEHNFAPQYEPIAGKRGRIAELRRLAKGAEEVYLATDPDREGEAIAFHVRYLLKGENPKSQILNSKFKRVTFHEITKTAIQEALQHPGQVDMALVNAQQARRVLDRLVGYKLSPVLWKKVRRGLSAGRVQSVAVRLIVEREGEIKAFVPEEYWEILVELNSGLMLELWKRDGKRVEVKDGETARGIVAELERALYKVAEVTESKQTSTPNPPFTTSLLQRAASNNFGWSAKQTMAVAQSLYEQGHITYHRTDSYNLASEAVLAARAYIGKQFGSEYVPASPRYYKIKSKSAQEAHEAIRPTNVGTEPTLAQSKEQKLYTLIRNRFLMCQMADAVFDKTAILVDAAASEHAYTLRTEGKRLIFDGWLRLGKSTEDVFVPQLTAGQVLTLVKVNPQQKFTAPPGRYTEAGLIKELEKRGIGRPSTYASIISTIQLRGYVTKEDKSFHPTAVGEAVTQFLVTNFDNVVAYEFTARMEDELDEVAEGKREWVAVVRAFYEPFAKKVGEVETTGERVKVAVESTGEQCPECKAGEVVIRTGRFGKFYSCSTYPTCKYTKQYVEYVNDQICPEDGGRVVVKKSKRGKFYGCENYPKCKWAAWKLAK